MLQRDELIACVRKAGDTARAARNQLSVRYKDDSSIVSSADEHAHEVLVQGLGSTLPVVSEEAPETHGSVQKDASFWLIDPLDGTKDFVAGRADWSVMVARIEGGIPVQGVVYAPQHERLWYAEKGRGAHVYENDVEVPLAVSTVAAVRGARAVASFSHASPTIEEFLVQLGLSVTRVGSIGVKLGIIAAGEADVYISEAPLAEWDTAAPQIILEEAGGLVTQLDGKPITYSGTDTRLRGCIATNTLLHSQLVAASRQVL